MRKSNRGRVVARLVLSAVLAAGCGGTAVPSVAPSSPPTPLITADPHLTEPASIDTVIRALTGAGLRITPNMASTGPGGEPVKRINATYSDWPLVLTQFTSAAALRDVGAFDASKPPIRGESPYIIVGLNVMIEFGPHSTNDRTPAPPTEQKRAAAIALVAALHPLIGPLAQRSTDPVELPGGGRAPSAAPAASARPSPEGSAP
jgi:hypothetical protein